MPAAALIAALPAILSMLDGLPAIIESVRVLIASAKSDPATTPEQAGQLDALAVRLTATAAAVQAVEIREA